MDRDSTSLFWILNGFFLDTDGVLTDTFKHKRYWSMDVSGKWRTSTPHTLMATVPHLPGLFCFFTELRRNSTEEPRGRPFRPRYGTVAFTAGQLIGPPLRKRSLLTGVQSTGSKMA